MITSVENAKEKIVANNKVYYGEYTLKHWIDLILTGNIVLPDYQRYFVWDKDKSIALINAILENQFVPPVTIGSYCEEGEKINLILDGQQRLTSILLAYLKLFPSKDNTKVIEKTADENDDENDDEVDFIEWDFNQLLSIIKSKNLRDKSDIHSAAVTVGYENMDIDVSIEDFEKCYLGFSFIVPETEDGKEQQKFYSKVFRSINIEGKTLLPLESRAALYYLNKDLVELFSPVFTNQIRVKEGKMDFVRYLSILTQYEKSGLEKVVRGYSKNMELYYENFIYAVVDGVETKDFINLSKKIPDLKYEPRMERLGRIIKELKLETNFDSIIDLDMYMFGLIYHIVFEDKTILNDKYDELIEKIKVKIVEIKNNTLHVKNPSALKHLKLRILSSIDTYKEFVS